MLRLSDISKKTEKDKEYEMISSLWKSFAFYPLRAALYSIKWAKNYGEEENNMKRRGGRIIYDFGDLSSCLLCIKRRKKLCITSEKGLYI